LNFHIKHYNYEDVKIWETDQIVDDMNWILPKRRIV